MYLDEALDMYRSEQQSEALDLIRSTYLRINVFIEDMTQTVYEERPVYDVSALFNHSNMCSIIQICVQSFKYVFNHSNMSSFPIFFISQFSSHTFRVSDIYSRTTREFVHLYVNLLLLNMWNVRRAAGTSPGGC